MRYQNAIYGPLIAVAVLFISSAWAENTCRIVSLTSLLTCSTNENREIGDVVTCEENVKVENAPQKMYVMPPVIFDAVVHPDSQQLQIVVHTNLTEYLQKKEMSNFDVQQEVFCNSNPNPPSSQILVVGITIIPDNNHAPTFDKSNYEYEVHETAPANHKITTSPIIVVDRDYKSSIGSEVVVDITAGNEEGFFTIVVVWDQTTRIRMYNVTLSLTTANLPYKEGGYPLTLTAKDKGTPPKWSTAQVTIKVQDVDNQDPIFQYPIYGSNLYITEKENKKLLISETTTDEGEEFKREFRLKLSPAKLFAFDQDIGINATILYELIPENGIFADYFRLGKLDPELTLTKIDEKLLKKDYVSLLVKAYQEDDHKRLAYALVNVYLTTKPYEVQPIFTQELELLRSQPEKVAFYTIQSSGKNLQYEIKGPDSERFELDENKLRLKEKIAKETQKLEIVIHANTKDTLIATNNIMKVIFNVVEVKRQDPLFNLTVHRVDVWSDSPEEDVVFAVKSLMKGVTYELSDGDKNLFQIDKIEGQIILKGILEEDFYSLKVTGTLTGEFARTETTEVLFNVVRKQQPSNLFTRQIYDVDIFSDAEENTIVFTIEATSSNVDVEIKKIEPKEGMFHLNSKQLILNGTLDPSIKKYTIDVIGQLEKERSEHTKVIVHVITKKRPKEALFAREIYAIEIESDISDKSTILTPETVDSNVVISIQKIEPADASHLFEIDSNRIVLNGSLNPSVKKYTLHLLGKIDEQSKTDSSKVNLHVIEVNRALSLLYTKSKYIVDVPECKRPGEEVFTIETTKEGVAIEIVGGNMSSFEVDDAGNIRLLEKLELQNEYYLEISGTLNATNETDETTVSFLVAKCGPVSKYFEKCLYSDTLQDSTPKDHVLLKLDTKIGKYSIISGNDEEAFDVKNGNLILKRAAKELKQDGYYIGISATASDKKVSEVTEEAMMILSMERSPQFLHPSPLVKVFAPSAPLSDYAFMINVKLSLKQVKFSLTDDSNNFTINSDTGLIYPVSDVTKIEGFHTVLHVTAQYNKYQNFFTSESKLDVHIFRLRWTQTLLMTSSSSPEHKNVEKIIKKLSDVSKCQIIPLQYQVLDKEPKAKTIVKRSAEPSFSENEDTKHQLLLMVSALKENKPLNLTQFEDLQIDQDKLTGEIGEYQIGQLPEPSEAKLEESQSKNNASNRGLVAAVAVLGTITSLLALGFVGIFVYKRCWPKEKDETENEESVLRRWKPPTPSQRRTTGPINSEASTSAVNRGLINDTGHLYVDIIPESQVYTDILSPEENDGKIVEKEEPVEAQNTAVAEQRTDDTAEDPTILQSEDVVYNETEVMHDREARKSVVTFSEQTDIIP